MRARVQAIECARTASGAPVVVSDLARAVAYTYGEITPGAVRTLMARVGDVTGKTFADLGCGKGKAVVQVAAEYDVKASRY